MNCDFFSTHKQTTDDEVLVSNIGKRKALIALYGVHQIIMNAMNISAIYISICGLIIDDIDAVSTHTHAH